MKHKNPHAVALGKLGGRVKSEQKTRAARINAKKGGRPRKKPVSWSPSFSLSRSSQQPVLAHRRSPHRRPNQDRAWQRSRLPIQNRLPRLNQHQRQSLSQSQLRLSLPPRGMPPRRQARRYQRPLMSSGAIPRSGLGHSRQRLRFRMGAQCSRGRRALVFRSFWMEIGDRGRTTACQVKPLVCLF